MNYSVILILLIMIGIDYLTGIIVAIYEKKVNSTIGRKGIFKKVGILICMGCCTVIDNFQLDGFTPLVPLVALFFTLNEVFSILENLGKLNVPVPSFLLETLKKKQER